jgi:hypothetical protein
MECAGCRINVPSVCEIRLSAHPNFAAVLALPRRDLPEIAQTDLPVGKLARSSLDRVPPRVALAARLANTGTAPSKVTPRNTKGQNQCRHFTEA